VHQGVHDKRSAFEHLLAECALSADDCGFVGDDVIDLPILRQAGFAASVPNAHVEVKTRVHYVTQASGGRGAAREICDLILHAQGNYDRAIAAYLT
jgi:3-deoxy-D-manno-octulosonate 8-phosphate phosphatase (KDO 8-P phosphatase)